MILGAGYINNLSELFEVFREYQGHEIIVFPLGKEGKIFLDFLRYTGNMRHICCVAKEKCLSENNFVNFRSVLQLDCMIHFFETATFIVSVPPNQNDKVCQKLADFGCKTILCISAEAHIAIKGRIQKLKSYGDIFFRYMNTFMEEENNLDRDLQYRIAMQDEICKVNTAAFESYRNYFRGKKLVLVGGGPTVSYYKPIPDAMHIGVNYAFLREDIDLYFNFTVDRMRKTGDDDRAALSDNRPATYEGFKRVFYKAFAGKAYVPGWLKHSEAISFKNDNVVRFFYIFTPNPWRHFVYQDICCHPLAFLGSTISCAFQFALFTYPAEIYLVGCDTTTGGHFFYFDEYDSVEHNMDILGVKIGYARLKMMARRFYPETRIISVNPVALKGLFEDVYTEEYKKILDAQAAVAAETQSAENNDSKN